MPKFSDLAANPDTLLAAIAAGDYFIVWDVSEADATKEIKVITRDNAFAAAYDEDALLDARLVLLEGAAFSMPFVFGDGINVLTAGALIDLPVPLDCTIVGWTVLSRVSGSVVFDVWKAAYAEYPPTVDDTIAGSEKPTLATATKNQDLALSTWTTACLAGDVITASVDSAALVKQVTLLLHLVKA